MSTEIVTMEFEGVEPLNEFGFDPIGEGLYDARVDAAEFGFAKSGDKSPMVTLTWKIEAGQYKGRTVRYNNVVFHPKLARIVKGVLIALGLKVPSKAVSTEGLAKAFARDAVGKLARITVADSAPNRETGKVFPEVKAIYPIGQDVPSAGPSDSGGEELPEL